MSASSFTFRSSNDCTDLFLGSSVLGRKFTLKDTASRITAANFGNLSIRYSSVGMRVAVSVAILLTHVAQVVGMASKKQVGGIDASAIIARMAHQFVIWKIAMGKFIGKAMSANIGAFKWLFQLSVAALVERTLPFPTIIGAASVNLLPKAFSEWACRGGLMTANVLTLLAWKLGYRDTLPTATFAEDRVRGMILHSNVSLLDLLTPPNDLTRCGGNYLPASIIPQEAAL